MCKITAFFVINGGKVIFIVGGGVCGGGKRFGGVIFSLSKSKGGNRFYFHFPSLRKFTPTSLSKFIGKINS